MPTPHRHDCVEVLLCLCDVGNFFLNNNVHPLKKGTLIIIHEMALHRSIASNNTYERYVLHVPRDTLKKVSTDKTDLSSVFSHSRCVQLEEKEYPLIKTLMEKCLQKNDCFGDDVLRDCAFLSLLVEIGRLMPPVDEMPDLKINLSSPVTHAIEWINSHLSDDLSLDKIASHCYVTKFHLCRLFKQEIGFSVGEYVTQQRIVYAEKLLLQGESVQKAGEEAGFSNYNHFIRTFSRQIGISPGRYRRQANTKQKDGI